MRRRDVWSSRIWERYTGAVTCNVITSSTHRWSIDKLSPRAQGYTAPVFRHPQGMTDLTCPTRRTGEGVGKSICFPTKVSDSSGLRESTRCFACRWPSRPQSPTRLRGMCRPLPSNTPVNRVSQVGAITALSKTFRPGRFGSKSMSAVRMKRLL